MYRAPGDGLPAKTSATADRRADLREEVFLRTHVALSPGKASKVELVNISLTGFLLRTKDHFSKGQKIMIALPGSPEMAAEVRWYLTGCAGCCFLQPLATHIYTQILSAIRSAPRDWLEQQP